MSGSTSKSEVVASVVNRYQMRRIVVAGFGQMHLIAGPFGATLLAVAGI